MLSRALLGQCLLMFLVAGAGFPVPGHGLHARTPQRIQQEYRTNTRIPSEEEWSPSIYGALSILVREDNTYVVFVDGKPWYESSATPYAVHVAGLWYLYTSGPSSRTGTDESSSGGRLTLTNRTVKTGTNVHKGQYEALELQWALAGLNVAYTTTFIAYPASGRLEFNQTFPTGIPRSATSDPGNEPLLSRFPDWRGDSLSTISYLTWSGLWSPGDQGIGLKGYSAGGVDGGVPLVQFDSTSVNQTAVVLAPASEFMVASLGVFNKPTPCLSFGVQGSVLTIPSGYTISASMSGASGVRLALVQWGASLLTQSGKPAYQGNSKGDVVGQALGYYTDNGAYYYNWWEGNMSASATLQAVQADALSRSIPIRYMQLDSWWYQWGDDHGVSSWTPRQVDNTFPDGTIPSSLPALQLHNRFWSQSNVYTSTLGSKFVNSSTGGVNKGEAFPIALGNSQQELFQHIMSQAQKEYRMAVYEQDWLVSQYSGMVAPQQDVYNASAWLRSMNDAAITNGVSILYCMPLPKFYLASSELHSVRHIRVSDDYWAYLSTGKPTWDIAPTSLLAYSLGLVPSKDVFWSTEINPDFRRPGSPTVWSNITEPNPCLQTLVCALSAGQVAFGDKIGYANATLLDMTARRDGDLLHPDIPATPIDRTWTAGQHGVIKARVATTYSAFTAEGFGALSPRVHRLSPPRPDWQGAGRGLRWHYLFVTSVQDQAVRVYPSDLDLGSPSVLVDGYAALRVLDTGVRRLDAPVEPFNEASPLTFQATTSPRVAAGSATNAPINSVIPFEYAVVAPTLFNSTLVVWGCLDKFITMSRQGVSIIAAERNTSAVVMQLVTEREEWVSTYFTWKDTQTGMWGKVQSIACPGPAPFVVISPEVVKCTFLATDASRYLGGARPWRHTDADRAMGSASDDVIGVRSRVKQ